MSTVLSKVTGNVQDAANRCVVISISKADCSGSVIYALKRNDDSFEGDPFQLHQDSERSLHMAERENCRKWNIFRIHFEVSEVRRHLYLRWKH